MRTWGLGRLQDCRIGRVGSIVRIRRIMEYLPSYTIGGLQHWSIGRVGGIQGVGGIRELEGLGRVGPGRALDFNNSIL